MLKFKIGSKPGTLTKADIDSLNTIDLEYMRAYTTKRIDGLRGKLAPACLDKISWMVHSFNTRYFADDKFRHTDWQVMNVNGAVYTIKKQVTYDKIHINAAMSINAASNYAECWVISKQKNIVVMDIKEWAA